MNAKIRELEKNIWAMSRELDQLRKDTPPAAVKNYSFHTLEGDVTLLDLFGGKDVLFAIHNMGQACRYCTLWADGLNAFLPHFEDKFSVVLLSKDPPELQRRFANSRGWRFRLASHGGGEYIREQGIPADSKNSPGLVCYVRKGDQVLRKNDAEFGPGDLFCSLWHVISLAGFNEENWTPQYSYWKAPAQLEDGGANVR